ncbi:hypothetical protein TWF696_004203 [Orbilia brochopaga]|uniref:BRCT domain-containing protein n=1 Tax=Orbilia brochopaga TaxID=3140254 RepID=A0AAV9V651_9PEZI
MPPPTSLKGATLKRKLIEIASTRSDRPTDVYVSSATGHQIREDGGSGTTGWRDDRNRKLKAQFANTGSVIGTKRKLGEMAANHAAVSSIAGSSSSSSSIPSSAATQVPAFNIASISSGSSPAKQIFSNCTVYINGNTALSGISDVELKRLLTAHGAKVSYHLARRQVTHVILTDPSAPSLLASSQSQPPFTSTPPSSVGTSSTTSASTSSTSVGQTSVSKATITSSGPAILASRKVELEMKGRVRSKIHYVSVDWALASMKNGRRLAETKFPVAPLREARQGTLAGCKSVKSAATQLSLVDMMKKQ